MSKVSGKGDHLENRVRQFLNAQPYLESIDELELSAEQRAGKKADYFVTAEGRREVVVELKSLRDCMDDKVQMILDEYASQAGWPVVVGTTSIEQVLAHHPRGREVNEHLVAAITSPIENGFRSANRQIRQTKANFGLPRAKGLLVFANGNNEIVTPEIAAYRIWQLWGKRKHGSPLERLRNRLGFGKRAYSSIDSVIVLQAPDIENGLAMGGLQYEGGLTVRGMDGTVEEHLHVGWARHHGIEYAAGVEIRSAEALGAFSRSGGRKTFNAAGRSK